MKPWQTAAAWKDGVPCTPIDRLCGIRRKMKAALAPMRAQNMSLWVSRLSPWVPRNASDEDGDERHENGGDLEPPCRPVVGMPAGSDEHGQHRRQKEKVRVGFHSAHPMCASPEWEVKVLKAVLPGGSVTLALCRGKRKPVQNPAAWNAATFHSQAKCEGGTHLCFRPVSVSFIISRPIVYRPLQSSGAFDRIGVMNPTVE